MSSDLFFFGALTGAIILTQIVWRRASPIGHIVNRWVRWAVFSLCGAKLLSDALDRPYWLLAAMLALLWLALETLYNWIAIKAISASRLPLFPRFAPSAGDIELIQHPRFRKLRDWLQANGFKRVQSLHASVVEEITLEVSIYQNADNTLRLQVSFLPQPRNRLTTALGFSTNTTAGDTFVTDNHFLPFAGFYPENWRLERRPLVRSAARLLRIHQTRLAQAGAGATPWTTEPLADLNAHQAELERVNTELGFLSKTAEREEQGSITPAGRYRIWKEYWLLNYLGRSARYV